MWIHLWYIIRTSVNVTEAHSTIIINK
jgi:hypothetical protein